jgi:two-component system LytT family sensor kinase
MKAIRQISMNPVFLHFVFWTGSIVFWNVYLYPNVDSGFYLVDGSVILVLLLNFIFSFYCLLPFIWFVKKIRFRTKIIVSVIFLVCLCFWFLSGNKTYNGLSESSEIKLIVKISAYYFTIYFAYILIFHLTIISSVIFNLNVLIPRFMNKIRFRIYMLSVIGLTVLAATLNYSLFNFGIDILFPKLYYLSYYKIWELCLIIAIYLLFTSGVLLTWQYRQMLVARRESVQNELSALKAQINPHFLFNNLNTIYAMASRNDARTPKIILQLSDFLRYVLYDTSSETIELEKEVEIIRTYVNLQKERINPEITTIEFITDGDFKGVDIAPLLLLPLVENCFKYGKGKSKGVIKLFVGFDGKILRLNTENKIAKREKPKGEKNSGIGISNVEKRLNLIYPGKFTLTYGEAEGLFKLEMSIILTME